MARKSSVIMSAEERKSAKNTLKDELSAAKLKLKTFKDEYKAVGKDISDTEKQITGLQTRINALTPAKKNVSSFQQAAHTL